MRLAKSRNILGILLVLALAVGTSERLQAGGVETVLWQEDFEQAEAAGWTYYTSAAESSDTMTFTGGVTHGDSRYALLAEGGVARVSLTKNLHSDGIELPIQQDVFLTFSYYCHADKSTDDEIMVSISGKDDPAAGRKSPGFSADLTVPVRTQLNRWRTITIPLPAFGESNVGRSLNYRISFSYFRPFADDYSLIIDDVKVTKGTQNQSVLIAPAGLRATPASISPNGDGYDDSTIIGAKLLCPAKWEIVIEDQMGRRVRQFSGEGTQLEQMWDGTDAEGTVVRSGAYRVVVKPAYLSANSSGEQISTKINVKTTEPAETINADFGVWSIGKSYRVGQRLAADRIVKQPIEFKVNRPSDAVTVEVARNEYAGFALKMSALRKDVKGVTIEVSDLVGAHKTSLSRQHIRFNGISYQELPGGYLWEDILALPSSFDLSKGKTQLVEGVVFVPKDVLPRTYEGVIRITAEGIPTQELALQVNVLDDVAERKWWQGEPIKLMLAKYQVMPRPEFFENSEKGYQQIAQAGFNVMIPYTGPDRLELYSTRAKEHGLNSVARSWINCFGDPSVKGPLFVIANGTQLPLYCPYSDARWGTSADEAVEGVPLPEMKIVANARYFARMSLNYPVVAMTMDFEIYNVGSPRPASQYTYCYCDHCMNKFRKVEGVKMPQLELQQRYTSLKDQGLLAQYKRLEDNELKRYARMVRQEVHKINPAMMFFVFPWEGHFPEMVARELGTEQSPVILGTEHTYGQGGYSTFIEDESDAIERNTNICLSQLREAKMAGMHFIYLPGVMPAYHSWNGGEIPAFCTKNALTVSRYGDGYWVFFQRTGEDSVDSFMECFKVANGKIDDGSYALGQ